MVKHFAKDNRKGGDPNLSHQSQVTALDGRGKGPELTREEVYHSPLEIEMKVSLSSEEDTTDEHHEIQDKIGTPGWVPNMEGL